MAHEVAEEGGAGKVLLPVRLLHLLHVELCAQAVGTADVRVETLRAAQQLERVVQQRLAPVVHRVHLHREPIQLVVALIGQEGILRTVLEIEVAVVQLAMVRAGAAEAFEVGVRLLQGGSGSGALGDPLLVRMPRNESEDWR